MNSVQFENPPTVPAVQEPHRAYQSAIRFNLKVIAQTHSSAGFLGCIDFFLSQTSHEMMTIATPDSSAAF